MKVTGTDETFQGHPPERIFNTLPIGYASWLAFYDSIPNWARITEEIQVVVGTTRDEFIKHFGREPQYADERFLISYEMKKDFLLARCAEQVLSIRLSYKKVLSMQSRFLGTTENSDYLSPLFNSAIAISIRRPIDE